MSLLTYVPIHNAKVLHSWRNLAKAQEGCMIQKDLPTKQNPRPATYKKYQPCNASTLVVNKHLLCTINTATAHDF